MENNSLKKTLKKGVEKISESAVDYVKARAERVGDHIEERIVGIEGALLNKFAAMALFVAGIVVLGLSLFSLLQEYLELNDTFSYLIMGIAIIFIGFIFIKLKGGK